MTDVGFPFSTEAMTRVLIVDDHPLFREALHSAVETVYPNVETIDATNVRNAVETLSKMGEFDLVLLDLNVPDVRGFEGLLEIRSKYPRIPVVIVSGHEDPQLIGEALSCGASGFIPKSSKKTELARAIELVLDGSVYIPEGYSSEPDEIVDERRKELLSRLTTLTPQQLRVLQMLREGLLNKQIAYEMSVGESTIKAHVSEILRKLNVYSRTQAVIEVSRLDISDLLTLDKSEPSSR